MKKKFPAHFPNDCPPDEAQPAEDHFFRLVTTDPPSNPDFLSYAVMYPKKRFNDRCKACGVSVFTRIEDIRKLQRRVVAYKPVQVAKGRARSEDGLALPTPNSEGNSHHTWWLFEGVTVAHNFVVIEESDEGTQ